MSETIERMAKAMQNSKAWPAVFQAGTARELARVSLEAIREATVEMKEAGFQHTGDPCWPENVGEAWTAMVNEALK